MPREKSLTSGLSFSLSIFAKLFNYKDFSENSVVIWANVFLFGNTQKQGEFCVFWNRTLIKRVKKVSIYTDLLLGYSFNFCRRIRESTQYGVFG